MSEILEQLRWPGITVNGRNCELIMELRQPESKWVEDEDGEFEPFFLDMSKHREIFVDLIGPAKAIHNSVTFHSTFIDFTEAYQAMWSQSVLTVLKKGREHWKESK